jgi:hypothetical protein
MDCDSEVAVLSSLAVWFFVLATKDIHPYSYQSTLFFVGI